MICKVIESFELSEIENKILVDFQDMLLQMKESATRKETQRQIENIYCGIMTLIYSNKEQNLDLVSLKLEYWSMYTKIM